MPDDKAALDKLRKSFVDRANQLGSADVSYNLLAGAHDVAWAMELAKEIQGATNTPEAEGLSRILLAHAIVTAKLARKAG